MANDGNRVTYLCERCGSDLVTLDAWAEWNVEQQQWVFGATYDLLHRRLAMEFVLASAPT
jgi:hypothetical protein